MEAISELQALQNSADWLNIIVKEWHTQDKRKTYKKYFLVNDGVTISPVLDYDQLNHFLLGMHRMKEILTAK